MAVVLNVREEPVQMMTPASPANSSRGSASPLQDVADAYGALRYSSSSTGLNESPPPDFLRGLEAIEETPAGCCSRMGKIVSRVWRRIEDFGDRHPFLQKFAGSVSGTVVGGAIVWAIFYKDSCR